MIVALIKCDNIGGLAMDMDLLKDRYVLAFNIIARQAWHTVSRQSKFTGTKSARMYCRSSTLLAKLWTWLLIL